MDVLRIAGREFRSRLIVGTGKYRSFPEMARCHEASGAGMAGAMLVGKLAEMQGFWPGVIAVVVGVAVGGVVGRWVGSLFVPAPPVGGPR